MEPKRLFTVELEGEGTSASLQCENGKELFAVALSMFNCIYENEGLRDLFEFISEQFIKDADFRKLLQNNSVKMPDFNQILKEIK